MGFTLFPKKDEFASPTVTAVYVPENITWKELDSELRKKGVGFGGNWEVLEVSVRYCFFDSHILY